MASQPPPAPRAGRLRSKKSVDVLVARQQLFESKKEKPPPIPETYLAKSGISPTVAEPHQLAPLSRMVANAPQTSTASSSRPDKFLKRLFSRNLKAPEPSADDLLDPGGGSLSTFRVTPSPHTRPLLSKPVPREEVIQFCGEAAANTSSGLAPAGIPVHADTTGSDSVDEKGQGPGGGNDASPRNLGAESGLVSSGRARDNTETFAPPVQGLSAFRDREKVAMEAASEARYVPEWSLFMKYYVEGRFNISNPPEPPPRGPDFGYLSAPAPLDEAKRLEAFRRVYVPYTAASLRAARHILGVAPHALTAQYGALSYFSRETEHFKAETGYHRRKIAREISIGAHVLLAGGEPIVILDTLKDWRMSGNPLVQGPPNIRFYVAAPIVTSGGHVVGALAFFGPEPRRHFSARRRRLLIDFTKLVLIDLIVNVVEHEAQLRQCQLAEAQADPHKPMPRKPVQSQPGVARTSEIVRLAEGATAKLWAKIRQELATLGDDDSEVGDQAGSQAGLDHALVHDQQTLETLKKQDRVKDVTLDVQPPGRAAAVQTAVIRGYTGRDSDLLLEEQIPGPQTTQPALNTAEDDVKGKDRHSVEHHLNHQGDQPAPRGSEQNAQVGMLPLDGRATRRQLAQEGSAGGEYPAEGTDLPLEEVNPRRPKGKHVLVEPDYPGMSNGHAVRVEDHRPPRQTSQQPFDGAGQVDKQAPRQMPLQGWVGPDYTVGGDAGLPGQLKPRPATGHSTLDGEEFTGGEASRHMTQQTLSHAVYNGNYSASRFREQITGLRKAQQTVKNPDSTGVHVADRKPQPNSAGAEPRGSDRAVAPGELVAAVEPARQTLDNQGHARGSGRALDGHTSRLPTVRMQHGTDRAAQGDDVSVSREGLGTRSHQGRDNAGYVGKGGATPGEAHAPLHQRTYGCVGHGKGSVVETRAFRVMTPESTPQSSSSRGLQSDGDRFLRAAKSLSNLRGTGYVRLEDGERPGRPAVPESPFHSAVPLNGGKSKGRAMPPGPSGSGEALPRLGRTLGPTPEEVLGRSRAFQGHRGAANQPASQIPVAAGRPFRRGANAFRPGTADGQHWRRDWRDGRDGRDGQSGAQGLGYGLHFRGE
ncbi:MAG: hypothetical protein M1832_002033 [Thelocarpon impressellum]|nr:MAG: hypothetical protein M1832_002033 [Thelocarpon impressellum]